MGILHVSSPSFKGNWCKNHYKWVENSVKIWLVPVWVLVSLATDVTIRANSYPATLIEFWFCWESLSSFNIDTLLFQKTHEKLEPCYWENEVSEIQDNKGLKQKFCRFQQRSNNYSKAFNTWNSFERSQDSERSHST